MGKIYVGQTNLKLQFNTGIDLTSASDIKIKYKDGNKKPGEFQAVIDDAAGGICSYTIQASGDLYMPGDWIFWVYVTFNDSTVAPGEPITIPVYEQGT